MKFTTAAIAATAGALVAASPCKPVSDEIKDGDVFRVMTVRSGSDFQYSSLQAANRGLIINASAQNASCGPEPHEYAEFQLRDGSLFLYTANPPQEMYVDRSGMGQGVIQYTTGAQPLIKNGERKGFTIDDNMNLVFRDQTGQDIGFQACSPSRGAEYSVWLDSVSNPAGYKDCLPFTAVAQKTADPVKCFYTNE
ncbi:cell wall protein [Stemphylium lycopersici]|uniref:Cell wall protein n=1 Tax=Stemphylium lycopersici TaxID=183478 RepID=A0A364MZJ8_STELY|nr:cell wall protein [Stemphylium lycopersici]RAR07289.1 cell wall protein [Stemphylium lycopersici]RAR07630.1 cell wall protein [Stemphylium lycopersici]